jgi:hypothetical protein
MASDFLTSFTAEVGQGTAQTPQPMRHLINLAPDGIDRCGLSTALIKKEQWINFTALPYVGKKRNVSNRNQDILILTVFL